MINKILAVLTLVLASSIASAESYWTSPVKIQDVSLYWLNGTYYLTTKFEGNITRENGAAITSCAKTNIDKTVGNHSSAIPNSTYIPQLLGLLTNAYNLQSKVKLFLLSSCGTAYGLRLTGVKAVP